MRLMESARFNLRNDRFGKFIIPVVFLLFVFCLFANTFGHGWTLDDFPVVVENPDIRSLSAFFRDSYPGRPLRELTFLLDHALFGDAPAGYHIQSIFWHGLNAALVFFLVRALQGGPAVAWLAALFFLVHPLQVEVVANISNRKDSLALAFSLLALLAYIKACTSEKRLSWLAAAGALATVAWYGKQNAVVLPVLFAAYEWVFLPPEKRFLFRHGRFWLIVCIAGFVAGIAWFFFFGGQELFLAIIPGVLAKVNVGLAGKSVAIYFLVALKAWAFMAMKLFVPLSLGPEYVFPAPKGWLDPWVVAAIAGLAGYGALLVVSFRRAPLVFWALVFTALFWLPVSNLWPLSYFAADRYLYAPSVGFCILLAWVIDRLTGTIPPLRHVIAIVLIAVLAVLTWHQNGVWRSHLTLWAQGVKVSPQSTSALNNLGGAWLQSGDLPKAVEYFQKAAANFNDPMPYYNLGQTLERMGEKEKALSAYRNFLAFNDPRYQAQAAQLRQHLLRVYGVFR